MLLLFCKFKPWFDVPSIKQNKLAPTHCKDTPLVAIFEVVNKACDKDVVPLTWARLASHHRSAATRPVSPNPSPTAG